LLAHLFDIPAPASTAYDPMAYDPIADGSRGRRRGCRHDDDDRNREDECDEPRADGEPAALLRHSEPVGE
jgi:hypothetical protein